MFPATSLPRFGVRRLDGALDIGVRTQKSNFEKQIQSGVEAAALQNGTPGRTRTRSLDVRPPQRGCRAGDPPVSKRRALPFELQERADFGLRISDCGFEN